MGGFYGSVQVRTEERPRVLAAADKAAKVFGIRLLIGPNLDGWIGVYPENAGQDQPVGELIAKEVGGEVLHALVHDDGVMAYWFWLDGDLVDAYWSAPGYFNSLDQRRQEQMTGDWQAFGSLVDGRGGEFFSILDRANPEITFESARLQKFMQFLGIRNGVTSYEYLKAGERVGIDGWEEFDEAPAEAVAAEQAAARQKQQEIENRKQSLKNDWILLSDLVEHQIVPKAVNASGGMLVAWEGFGRGENRIDFYRSPWGEAEPGEIETGGPVNSASADGAGARVAMALGNRVVVWKTKGWRPILELVEADWAVQCALSPDGKLLAYASREGVFVHEIDSGKRITALTTHDGAALAFDSTGEWLVSGGSAVWIASIKGKEPWRELYAGGQTSPTPELSQAVQKQMTKVDLNAMEQKWRASLDAAIQKLAAAGGNTPATAALVEKMRAQLEKQVGEMHAKFENLKAGKLPPPRQSIENVLCAGFTHDGKKLWLGTDRGIRVYEWEAVKAAPGGSAMPPPIIAHDPGQGVGAASHGLVYSAAEIPGRNALLFGGYLGQICHLDLEAGDVRDLMKVPDGGAIVGLCIDPEVTAVGVCSRPPLGEGADPQDERAVWQIWSYPALLKLQG